MPEPLWLCELRRLHAAHHSDAAIADALTEKFWPRTFYRMQVWRLRKRHGLKSWKRHRTGFAAGMLEARRWRWRRLQVDAGWLHLLPAQVEGEGGSGWGEGHELCPTEVRILTALCDHGPLTRLQLAGAIGRCGRPGGKLTCCLLRLRAVDLVEVLQVRPRVARGFWAVYTLAPAAGQRGWEVR